MGSDLLQEFRVLVNAHPRAKEIETTFPATYHKALASLSPDPFKCLEKALTCIDAFGELAEMDKKMDEVYFQELMESEYFMVSGQSKNGNPILWLRCSPFENGIWRLAYNTPRFWAYVRAGVAGYLAAVTALAVDNWKFKSYALYLDCTGLGVLDFNLKANATVMRITSAVVLTPPKNSIIFGVGYPIAIILKGLQKSGLFPDTKVDCYAKRTVGGVSKFVADHLTIPFYYFGGCSEAEKLKWGTVGASYDREKVGNMLFCFRTMNGGPSLCAAEVYNASEYNLLQDERATRKHENVSHSPSEVKLEVIDECDEEDDVW